MLCYFLLFIFSFLILFIFQYYFSHVFYSCLAPVFLTFPPSSAFFLFSNFHYLSLILNLSFLHISYTVFRTLLIFAYCAPCKTAFWSDFWDPDFHFFEFNFWERFWGDFRRIFGDVFKLFLVQFCPFFVRVFKVFLCL